MHHSIRAVVPPVCSLVLLVAATGCDNGQTKETADTATCDAALDYAFPEDGATDAFYRTAVEFHLDGEDPGATVTLEGAGGEIPGTTTLSESGYVVSFEADEPLDPQSDYTATLDYCAGQETSSFTTSDYGLARTGSPVGNTYVVDLSAARFTQPEALAGIISQALRFDVLIEVLDLEDAATISMLGAIAEEDSDPPVQDFCGATMDFSDADFTEDPYFHLGPQDAYFALPTHDMNLSDLEISGAFAVDASTFGGGAIRGVLDVRENVGVYEEMGLKVEDGDDVCEALPTLGVECQPCDSDGESYCMTIAADSIEAPVVEDLTLEEVDEARCHEQCDDNAEDCSL